MTSSESTNRSDTHAADSLQGLDLTPADEAELCAALEKAFDYRGDVTVTLKDGSTVAGYIFDRRSGSGLSDSYVRLMTADTGDKVRVAYADVARLEFTGRDAAAGRSWETWLAKYVEKKTKGQTASLEPEPLDDPAPHVDPT